MDLFVVLKIAGTAVFSLGTIPGGEQGCRDMQEMIAIDIDKSFEQHPYGMTTDNGAVYRRADFSVSCEANRPVLEGKLAALSNP